jgi:hypothetical protein
LKNILNQSFYIILKVKKKIFFFSFEQCGNQ